MGGCFYVRIAWDLAGRIFRQTSQADYVQVQVQRSTGRRMSQQHYQAVAIGPIVYGVALAAAFISVMASLGISLGLVCFFAVANSAGA